MEIQEPGHTLILKHKRIAMIPLIQSQGGYLSQEHLLRTGTILALQFKHGLFRQHLVLQRLRTGIIHRQNVKLC